MTIRGFGQQERWTIREDIREVASVWQLSMHHELVRVCLLKRPLYLIWAFPQLYYTLYIYQYICIRTALHNAALLNILMRVCSLKRPLYLI